MPIIWDYCYEGPRRDRICTPANHRKNGKGKETPHSLPQQDEQEKYIYSSQGVVSFPDIPGKSGTVQIIFSIPSPVFMNMWFSQGRM